MKDIPTQFNQLNLLAQQDQAFIEIEPCPSCGSMQAIQVPGAGPHYKGLRCVSCDRFIRWIAKPKGEA